MNKEKTKIETLKQKIELLVTYIKRYFLILLIVSIIGGVLGGLVTRITYTPEYTVTQAFSIKLHKHPEASNATIKDNQISSTIPSLLSSDVFMDYMFPFIKEADAIGKFKVSSLSSTNIFYLTVSARNNEKCIKIIKLIQEHYNEIAKNVIGDSEMEYFTEPATSLLPSNTPNFTLGIIAGVLIGFFAVFLLLAFKAYLTKIISTSAEAESVAKSKCLSTFNTTRVKRRSSEKEKGKFKMPLITEDSCELDLLQSVATLTSNTTNICSKNGYKSILFTSTISGEGKSSISLNFALSLAEKGKKVVIVDADLRTPSIADYLEINTLNGLLTDAISGKIDLADAITKTENGIYILGNIEHSENAFEASTSKSFGRIIKELETEFDYVIVDAAPVGILGEAISIADSVDGFIYVISHNYIDQNSLLRGLTAIESSNAKKLGCVLNYKK